MLPVLRLSPCTLEDPPMHWSIGRRFLAVTAVLLALPAAAQAAGEKPGKKAGKRPNILYIMTDDHANAAIGAYDSHLKKVVKTPNLDKLAKQGMLFRNSLV